jgi:hypothetical protein
MPVGVQTKRAGGVLFLTFQVANDAILLYKHFMYLIIDLLSLEDLLKSV